MTITLHWWYVPIALFLIPLIYTTFRRSPSNWWDMQVDVMLVTLCCWCLALGIAVAKFVF